MTLLTADLLKSLNTNDLKEIKIKIGEREYLAFVRRKTAKIRQEELAFISPRLISVGKDGDGNDLVSVDPSRARELAAWRVASLVCDDEGNPLYNFELLMEQDDDNLTAIDEAVVAALAQKTPEAEAKN